MKRLFPGCFPTFPIMKSPTLQKPSPRIGLKGQRWTSSLTFNLPLCVFPGWGHRTRRTQGTWVREASENVSFLLLLLYFFLFFPLSSRSHSLLPFLPPLPYHLKLWLSFSWTREPNNCPQEAAWTQLTSQKTTAHKENKWTQFLPVIHNPVTEFTFMLSIHHFHMQSTYICIFLNLHRY